MFATNSLCLFRCRVNFCRSAIYVQSNFYSSQDPYNLASLKRGTGGRSSFNGFVVTVFGATGFLGRYVCNRLAKFGSQLILPYRCDNYSPLRLKVCGDLGQVLFHPYDIRDDETISKAIKYSNVVVNLIGRDWETNNFSFKKLHVDYTRKLAHLSKKAGVKRFIHVSALNADLHPQPCILSTGSQFLSTKAQGEKAVLEEFPTATILRPSDMYGQEDRFLTYYMGRRRRHNTWIPLWYRGEKTIKQPVFVSDVAAGIVEAIKDPETAGKIYQAVGPRRYQLSELVDWLFRIVKRYDVKRYELRYDPLFKLRVNIAEALRLRDPLGDLHWERIEREYVTDTVYDTLPTLEDLGVQLTTMEHQVPWELKAWTLGLYQGPEVEELYTKETPPKVVTT